MENVNKNLKVGSLVTYKNCYSVGKIVKLNGNTATLELTMTKELVNKRVSSLTEYKTPVAYWNEQEIAAGQAKHKHGEVVYTCLSGDSSCKMVWDEKNQNCVDSKEFVF